MFVPPAHLRINLRGLMEKAIADWSTTQPLGFTRPVVEECGEFIFAEMASAGLCREHGDEVWFNDSATAKDYRDSIFAALDHWLVKTEISPPTPKAAPLPFSSAGVAGAPAVDPYYAFDESWGPPPAIRRRAPEPTRVPSPSSNKDLLLGGSSEPPIRVWLIALALGIAAFLFWCFFGATGSVSTN